jgi:hypothetical protein
MRPNLCTLRCPRPGAAAQAAKHDAEAEAPLAIDVREIETRIVFVEGAGVIYESVPNFSV